MCNNIFMRLKRWTTSTDRATIWILWFHFLSHWCSLFLSNLSPPPLHHIISIYLKRWTSSQELVNSWFVCRGPVEMTVLCINVREKLKVVVYRFDCGIKSAGFPKVTSVWELTGECSVRKMKMKCKFQRFSNFLQARTRNHFFTIYVDVIPFYVLACWISSEILYYSVHAVILYLYLHFVVLYQYNMQHLTQSSTRKY